MAHDAQPGLLLAGRDERCHLRVESPDASRLHATILRLHRRLALRDEAGAGTTRVADRPARVAFLDPGTALALGGAAVSVEGGEVPSPRPDGARAVDAATFQALDEAGHPAALAGHVAVLAAAAARAGAVEEQLRGLELTPARAELVARLAREAWHARAAHARRALCAALGRDAGPDPAAWRPLVAAASVSVVLLGWG